MNMRLEHMELEALELRLRETGGFAVRILRAAAAACAGRDAARANVVLGFETDARRDQAWAQAAARSMLAGALGPAEAERVRAVIRAQTVVERSMDVALRVADLGRLSARHGAPDVRELDHLCRLSDVVAGTLSEALAVAGGPRRELMAMAEELLRRAENASALAERQLHAGRKLCLVS
jgi:hypothetical protein